MVNGQSLTFDVLGLYQDVFMMRDRQTGTVWAHLDGNASQGPLVGERLAFVPLPQMAWADWLAEHPGTLVLDPDTPYADRYRSVRIGQPNRGDALWGDDRLAANTLVVGVEANGAFVGFPIDAIGREGGVVNTEVGGVPVVVVYDAGSQTGIAFERTVGGQTLEFANTPAIRGFRLHDAETASTWDIGGHAVDGPLVGASLNFVPSFISEWYGWSGYHPETGLYEGSGL